jgi:hypothetical protein
MVGIDSMVKCHQVGEPCAMSAKSDDDAIPKRLRGSVKRAWAKAPPAQDLVIEYLETIYRETRTWWNDDSYHKDVESVREASMHGRLKKSYARVLIELSAPPHISPQEKSKYETVVRYARASKVRPSDFQAFIKENGGIKGCIRKSQERKKKG